MQKYPQDPIIRGKYFSIKKNFSKILKKSKKEQKDELLEKIRQMEDKNPTVFWNLIKNIKQKKEQGEVIDPDEFFEHFKTLHSSKTDKHFDEAFAKNIHESVKSNTNVITIDALDKQITRSELTKVTSTLKNRKASGFDSISNEMIKCSIGDLGGIILKLFNNILHSSNYPQQW